MTVQDAKGILTGGGTRHRVLQAHDHGSAAQEVLPIVKKSTEKVGLARKYNQYAERGVGLGLIKQEHASLDDYVTQKALDGLYFMVAEEEKKIRKDPVGTASSILKKVFGALSK